MCEKCLLQKRSYLFVYLLTHSKHIHGRMFAHGAMGSRIDPLWRTNSDTSRFNQCSTSGVTKAVICAILSLGMVHIKGALLPCSGGSSRFPVSLSEWFFIICLTPRSCKYNVLIALLNKTFSSLKRY